MEAADSELIEKVMDKLQEYWMNDQDNGGEAFFKNFIGPHADKFTEGYDDPENNDNKLVYTEIHKDYEKHFEKKMEEIIAQCGSTSDQFFKALKSARDNDDSQGTFYIELIDVVSNYECFILNIKQYKQDLAAE